MKIKKGMEEDYKRGLENNRDGLGKTRFANEAKKNIENIPSAQPEHEKGEWIRHYCEDGNPDGWQCDQCAEWYYFGETKPNFCPNCGADMREEE